VLPGDEIERCGSRGAGQRTDSAQIGGAFISAKVGRFATAQEIVPEPFMPVGLLTLEIHIPDAQSLKDKRQVLRSLKDKLRRQFNVAVAELDHHDVWQRSVVGVVTLSNEERHVQESLQKVLDEADRILGSFLISQKFEIV
jgi:uncharacterized protein YlxP (DUF503 family)